MSSDRDQHMIIYISEERKDKQKGWFCVVKIGLLVLKTAQAWVCFTDCAVDGKFWSVYQDSQVLCVMIARAVLPVHLYLSMNEESYVTIVKQTRWRKPIAMSHGVSYLSKRYRMGQERNLCILRPLILHWRSVNCVQWGSVTRICSDNGNVIRCVR